MDENAPALTHLWRICHIRFCHTDSITLTADAGGKDYAVDTQGFGKVSFHDYLAYCSSRLAYWLSYTHFSDMILLMDKL